MPSSSSGLDDTINPGESQKRARRGSRGRLFNGRLQSNTAHRSLLEADVDASMFASVAVDALSQPPCGLFKSPQTWRASIRSSGAYLYGVEGLGSRTSSKAEADLDTAKRSMVEVSCTF